MNKKHQLSQGNGFTIGFKGEPHGFDPAAEVKPSPKRPGHVKGGFGAQGGTYVRPDKSKSSLTIKRQTA